MSGAMLACCIGLVLLFTKDPLEGHHKLAKATSEH